jgi:YVTN family beta-propeller protein
LNWRESALQIITAIIGSGLAVTSFTTYLAEIYNQPDINLIIDERSNIKLSPYPEYYEVSVINNGRSSANNMKLSLFFFGNITHYSKVLSDESINITQNVSENLAMSGVIDARIPSELSAYIPRLAPDAMVVIYVWAEPWASIDPSDPSSFIIPYYIAASYDEGNVDYSSFRQFDPTNVISNLPQLHNVEKELPLSHRISIITLILSIIFFAIVVRFRRMRQLREMNKRKQMSLDTYSQNLTDKAEIKIDIYLAIPAILIGAIFVFFVFEVIPKSLVIPDLIANPFDIIAATQIPINQEVTSFDGRIVVPYVPLVLAIVFCVIVFIIRGLMAFQIAKLIVKFSTVSNINNKGAVVSSHTLIKPIERQLFVYSFILMATPIYSIISLFFPVSIALSDDQLLLLTLAIDIIRMMVLILIIPRLVVGDTILIKTLYRTAGVISALSGILQLVPGFLILRTLDQILHAQIGYLLIGYLPNTGDQASNQLFSNPFILLFGASSIVLIVVGIIQLVWSYLLFKHPRLIWCSVGVIGSILLFVFWVAARVFFPYVYGVFTAGLVGYIPVSEMMMLIISITGLAVALLQIGFIVVAQAIAFKEKQIHPDIRRRWFQITVRRTPKEHKRQDQSAASSRTLITIFIILSVTTGLVIIFAVAMGQQTQGYQSYENMILVTDSRNKAVYTADQFSNELSVWRIGEGLRNLELPRSIATMAVNPNTNILYVHDSSRNSRLLLVDAGNDKMRDGPIFPSGIEGIAVNPNTNTVYASSYNYTRSLVHVINGTTNKVTANISTEVRFGGNQIAVNPNTNKVYLGDDRLSDNTTNYLQVIDGTTNKVTANIPEINSPVSTISVNPATNIIYVLVPHPSDSSYSSVYVIDGNTNKIKQKIEMRTYIRALAVKSDDSRIYAANVYPSNTVSVMDGNTNRVIRTIETDGSIRNMMLFGNRLFLFSSGPDGIYLVDTTSSDRILGFSGWNGFPSYCSSVNSADC